MFEDRLQPLHELGRHHAVDDPMVGAERHRHLMAGPHRTVFDDHGLAGRAHGQDSRFGRIDDRAELFDAEHAEVADREMTLADVFQPTFPRLFDDAFRLGRQLGERERVHMRATTGTTSPSSTPTAMPIFACGYSTISLPTIWLRTAGNSRIARPTASTITSLSVQFAAAFCSR